jgi:hypothetical protein
MENLYISGIVLAVVGALNWGRVGQLKFDLSGRYSSYLPAAVGCKATNDPFQIVPECPNDCLYEYEGLCGDEKKCVNCACTAYMNHSNEQVYAGPQSCLLSNWQIENKLRK